jgi:hypothetical protein
MLVLAFLPVLGWNAQHGWITLTHLSERGGLKEAWRFQPRFLYEFVGAEAGLLNPIFFFALVWAVAGSLARARRQPLTLYLLAMGLPVFGGYLLYTLRARVLPNWIAPAVVPLFAVMVIYWEQRWLAGSRHVKPWLTAGLTLGFGFVGFMHAPELLKPLTGLDVPRKFDPLRRVRGWKEVAQTLETERQKVSADGKPVFFIMDHYGIASELTFYHPAARQSLDTDPWVYYVRALQPENQFYFWPGYQHRKGQNALFIRETGQPDPPRATLLADFESVTYLGMRESLHRGNSSRRFQIYLCRNLR